MCVNYNRHIEASHWSTTLVIESSPESISNLTEVKGREMEQEDEEEEDEEEDEEDEEEVEEDTEEAEFSEHPGSTKQIISACIYQAVGPTSNRVHAKMPYLLVVLLLEKIPAHMPQKERPRRRRRQRHRRR